MKPRVREGYRKHLILPESPVEGERVSFYTNASTLIARGYNRVVIGDRGPYIEFTEDQIQKESFGIPKDQMWRFDVQAGWRCYYYEYRSKDSSYVKLYRQKRRVKYADYKEGLFYISPFELTSDLYPVLIRSNDET